MGSGVHQKLSEPQRGHFDRVRTWGSFSTVSPSGLMPVENVLPVFFSLNAAGPGPGGRGDERLFREQPVTQSLGLRHFNAMYHTPLPPPRPTKNHPDIGLIDPPS